VGEIGTSIKLAILAGCGQFNRSPSVATERA
jgi:hypothetical protein